MRALVVDDSAAFGRIIKDALEASRNIEVVKLCRGGRAALEYMRGNVPDLVTLDIEMPDMNGLEVLRAMQSEGIKAPVIVVSAASERARELAIRALELGALDVLQKPEGSSAQDSLSQLRDRLGPLLAAAAHRMEVRSILRGRQSGLAMPQETPAPSSPPPVPIRRLYSPPPNTSAIDDAILGSAAARRLGPRLKPSMVLIGVSTGGPEALGRLIPKLPGAFHLPVLIVQHMPPLFTQSLATKLDASSALRVKEAEEREIAVPGTVYIAPGGTHLKIVPGARGEIVMHLAADPPENNCRPAVDYLFRSAAVGFPGRAVGVILTGMGRDGTLGLRLLKATGCSTIAQDEASCTVFGMPKEAINAGVVDTIAPLKEIASEILKAVH